MSAIYRFARPDGAGVAVAQAAGVANWVLETVASKMVRLIEFGWSGEDLTGAVMRTRISRDTAIGTGTRTALTLAAESPSAPASAAFAVSTYATAQPTIAVGVLFSKAWNSQGGLVHMQFPPGRGFSLIGAASLECRGDIGTGFLTTDGAFEEE